MNKKWLFLVVIALIIVTALGVWRLNMQTRHSNDSHDYNGNPNAKNAAHTILSAPKQKLNPIQYISIQNSDLPPAEIKKSQQDFENLKKIGSLSGGKVTHEFGKTAALKIALQRAGNIQNIYEKLMFKPIDIDGILGEKFTLIGADYSGNNVEGKYNSIFRSYQTKISQNQQSQNGQQFEINELLVTADNMQLIIYTESLNFELLGYPATLQQLSLNQQPVFDLDVVVGNRAFSISALGMTKAEFLNYCKAIITAAQQSS